MVWHSDYWDGPLSGIALYNNNYVWFNFTRLEDVGGDYNILQGNDLIRWYNLHEMNEEDIKIKFNVINMFRGMVGFHCDHNPELYRLGRSLVTGKTSREFYRIKDELDDVDCTKNPIVATVSELDFQQFLRRI